MEQYEIWDCSCNGISTISKDKNKIINKTIKNIEQGIWDFNGTKKLDSQKIKITFSDDTFVEFSVSEWGGVDYYE